MHIVVNMLCYRGQLHPQNVGVVVLDQAARSGAGQGGVCADGVDVQKPLNELEIYHDPI